MSKKTRTKTNKAGKLMKCDGQMLKKVIEAKGYKLYELSRMLRYCSDYLTSCCRQNQISDVAAKYLMDYKIFPQMYDLEGEIKVGEPKDDNKTTKNILDVQAMRDIVLSHAAEELKAETDKEIVNRLNRKAVEGIDYGYGPAPKNTSYCSYYAAGHDIAKGVFKLMQVAMNDLKHDHEFKELIKQAVKEAYEEL